MGLLCSSLCLLLAVFLLIVRGPLRSANRLLAAFLLLTAIDTLGWAAALLPTVARELLPYRLPLAFLQMPLLYVYTVRLCYPARPTFRHGIAAVAVACLSLATLVPRALGRGPENGLDWLLNSLALHGQFYMYIALMVGVLVQYRRAYPQTHSNPAALTFRWLAVVTGVSFLAHSLVLVKSWAWLGQRSTAPALELLVAGVAVAVVCGMTLSALLRQDLFLGLEDELAAAPAEVSEPVAQHPAGAGAIARLRSHMEAQAPYLDPSLTVRRLAEQLGLGQRELSNLLNQQLGLHFFDFVNQYRVQRAAALLLDPARRELSVLEIAFEAGFNTKSSFNAAFSKHLGSTPSAYRRAGTPRSSEAMTLQPP